MKIDIKKFQDLSLEEKKEVLEWRNDKTIREFMYDKEPILLENHLNFINNLDDSRVYLKADDIGVINFRIKNNFAEIGLHKNPNKQKVGNILMNTLINYGFNTLKLDKLILYVFENNKKAINLYKNFGFNEVDKKDNFIKMELTNENRKN